MDLISLAAAKNYANKVAAGITAARVEGNSIILTLVDGTEAKCSLPVPKDGISVVDLSIDNDGSLLCHMSDGSTIDAGKVPMTDIELTDYYTKEETDVLLENSGLKTFIWDGLSSEENVDNLTFFEEFYADLVASEGKTRLLVTTPNVVSPTYMNAEVGVDKSGTDAYLTISTYPSWWSSVEWDSEEYNLYTSTAYVNIENGKCVEVSELRDCEAEFHFLSTTRQYDSGDYYTPISDGSPVSKGYMIEALREGKYSISPDQLEEEFQGLITEPIITIDDEDPTEIEFVKYEGETDGEYDFVYEDNWWGDGYRSTNGAHDNSYALGKFILNNPGDKTIRVSIDYDLTCATGDTAVFSELDTELTADSWNDYTNAYKVITGETYIYGSIAYDLTPGEHFITFKYMVGWKDEGEGQGDSLMVSFGWTNGAVQEHYIATQQYVDDSIANINIPEVDLTNYYTKEEMDIKMQENVSPKIFELTLPISLSSVSSSSTYITDANVVNAVNKLFTDAAAKGGDTCLLLVHFKSGKTMDSILFESNDMYYYTATRWGGHCNFTSYYMGNESFESPQQIVIYLGAGTWDANTGAHTGVRISIQRNLQWALAQERNVLTKTNTNSYTPTSDYHPATKNYVDSSISKAITGALTSAY